MTNDFSKRTWITGTGLKHSVPLYPWHTDARKTVASMLLGHFDKSYILRKISESISRNTVMACVSTYSTEYKASVHDCFAFK